MAERGAPQFPSSSFPDEADQRLLGIYRQRQDDYVLQRVRTPGGRITPEQLSALSALACDVGARPFLHLTTRQAIELHGLRPDDVPRVHEAVATVGLTTVGSAGDTVRNSTVDPLGGLVPGSVDLLPLARAVESALRELPGVWSLPRKFKISYSGDERGSMRPWTSDVGIVARADGTLTAIVAGSLGAKPASGIHFADGLGASDVAALAVAAVRLHAQMGDRENRRQARLRHVRERIGDEAFLTALRMLWSEACSVPIAVPEPAVPPIADGGIDHVRLAVLGGDLAVDDASLLAEVLNREEGFVRLGIEHDLHVFGVELGKLPDSLRRLASPRRVVACPGSELCSKAAGPTRDAAEVLVAIAESNPELLFSVSGCPNSCSHAAAAGVGVTSRMKREADSRVPVFRVAVGGRSGASPRLAETIAVDVQLADLATTVEAALAAGAGAEEVGS